MRVLMISHMWPVKNDLHGIFVVRLVAALRTAGVDVRVLAPLPWAPPGIGLVSAKWGAYRATGQQAGQLLARPRYPGLPREVGLAHWGWRVAPTLRRQLTAWQKADQWKPDVVHAQTSLMGGSAARQARLKPLVVTTHGRDLNVYWPAQESFRQCIRQTYKYADGRIWVSGWLQERAGELGAVQADRKDRVIYSGIESMPDLGGGVWENGIRIGVVARLHEQKGLHYLLEAAAWLQRRGRAVQIRIVGSGPDRGRLAEKVAELNLGAQVVWLEERPTGAAFAALQGCNMFVLPSLVEGFGLVYLEAMRAGLPVVATTGTGFSELVNDGDTALLVPQRNSTVLAEVIERLSTDTELRTSLAEAGRKLADKFTWERSAAEHIHLYNQVISG